MRKRVRKAMEKLSSNGYVDILQSCTTLEERYRRLSGFLPEVAGWELSIARRELIYYIQKDLNVHLGVCDFYWVSEHKQFCLITKEPCTCDMFHLSCHYLEQMKEGREALTVS